VKRSTCRCDVSRAVNQFVCAVTTVCYESASFVRLCPRVGCLLYALPNGVSTQEYFSPR